MAEDWWDRMHDRMDGANGGMGGRMHDVMGGGAWWGLGWLVLVLLVVAVVAVVVLATSHRPSGALPPPPPQPGAPVAPPDAAEALLRERFARGEIDQGEYDERLARLRSTR